MINIAGLNDASIQRTADIISTGRLAAFPTETVYGLGADATNDGAVAAIFALKNRPDFNPLIVHVPDIDSASEHVHFTPIAHTLATAFWPGPMSLVLERKDQSTVSLLAVAGLDTMAVRIPSHSIARAILNRANCPIAAPSANLSGEVSPTEAAHVVNSFRNIKTMDTFSVLDGGRCAVGLESTVIDARGDVPVLLRPGGVTFEELTERIGKLKLVSENELTHRSPGQLSRHYAPQTPLRLNVSAPRSGEGLLGFGPSTTLSTQNLSPSGNLTEAAANLFKMLRIMDEENLKSIAVAPIPSMGLGQAINDRLKRAATRIAAE
ncbi:MAG: threonylcarbamoyl-AMP synthase [Rhodospirillaceae bacterium TMED8]|nr:threonylcarbamoyl-AMP synthase [Magnetovibrio sp.]OUT50857.1 MAG: threonylcarbamoyl-AMP synthase [Rhodospirillaceae bacterium TMED8]